MLFDIFSISNKIHVYNIWLMNRLSRENLLRCTIAYCYLQAGWLARMKWSFWSPKFEVFPNIGVVMCIETILPQMHYLTWVYGSMFSKSINDFRLRLVGHWMGNRLNATSVLLSQTKCHSLLNNNDWWFYTVYYSLIIICTEQLNSKPVKRFNQYFKREYYCYGWSEWKKKR